MNQIEHIFYWSILAGQIVLCGIVFGRGVQRRLPFFAAYTLVILAGTVWIGLAYALFGYRSTNSYNVYWATTLLDLILRSLAIVELCRYGLRAYRGIWAFACRFLNILGILFLAHAAIDAWGQPNRIGIYGLSLERDFDLASFVILVALFVIRRYYGVTLEPFQRAVAFGICLFCAVDVINNTVVRNFYVGDLFSWLSTSRMYLWPTLQPINDRVNDWYGVVQFLSTVMSMGVWCFALRKPLPEPIVAPVLLPADVYREFSPAINIRLATFNDRLAELLKP